MKTFKLAVAFVGTLLSFALMGQNSNTVYITEGNEPSESDLDQWVEPSALFQVDSKDQGILIPRMDKSEMELIESPAEGLLVYVECLTSDFPACDPANDGIWVYGNYAVTVDDIQTVLHGWHQITTGGAGGGASFWNYIDDRTVNINEGVVEVNDFLFINNTEGNVGGLQLHSTNIESIIRSDAPFADEGEKRTLALLNFEAIKPSPATDLGTCANTRFSDFYLTSSPTFDIEDDEISMFNINLGMEGTGIDNNSVARFGMSIRAPYDLINDGAIDSEGTVTNIPEGYFSISKGGIAPDANCDPTGPALGEHQYFSVGAGGNVGINMGDPTENWPRFPLHVNGESHFNGDATVTGELTIEEVNSPTGQYDVLVRDVNDDVSRVSLDELPFTDSQQLDLNSTGLLTLTNGGSEQMAIYREGGNMHFAEQGLLGNNSTSNIRFGFALVQNVANSNQNIFLGQNAGLSFSGGNDNVFIGSYSGYRFGAGSNNIFLGYKAGPPTPTNMSNQLWIGLVGDQPMIGGNLSEGHVGIGIANPTEALEVGNHGAFVPPVYSSLNELVSVLGGPNTAKPGSMAVVDNGNQDQEQQEGLYVFFGNAWHKTAIE